MNENPYSSPDSANDAPAPIKKPFLNGQRVLEWSVVFVILAVLVALLLPASRRSGGSIRRTMCKNNLKQIMFALYNYQEVYGSFPPAFTVDSEGQPLHSWRTLILPYMDEQQLYDKIDLSQPWNAPINQEAALRVPFYSCPSANLDRGMTTYQAVVGPDAFFSPNRLTSITDVTDGTAMTVAIVEVDPEHAVHWMAPFDHGLEFLGLLNPDTKTPHKAGTHIGVADGAARFLSNKVPPQTRQALITIHGGETIGDF